MFARLFADFVSGQVISLAVGNGGGRVSVRRKVVEFCGATVRALWHSVLLGIANLGIKLTESSRFVSGIASARP
jgi:hypothetical protein